MNTLYDSIFQDFLLALDGSKKDLFVNGYFGGNNEDFLKILTTQSFFENKNILTITESNKKLIKSILAKHKNTDFDFIFFLYPIFSRMEFRDLLEKNGISGRLIIFTYEKISDEKWSDNFSLKNLSFRDYARENESEIAIKELLQKGGSLKNFEDLAEKYLFSGSFLENILFPDDISKKFDALIENISNEVFSGEKENFQAFIEYLPSIIGQLYKEDRIAKDLHISRRKVKKYHDILLKYDIIRVLEPFFSDSSMELTRHPKYYFSDLSFFRGALKERYMIGKNRESVIENFTFLELSKRLDDTHRLYFWRKKSGTNVSFVIQNSNTAGLSPIDISLSSEKFTPAMKSFYESYLDEVEHAMQLHDRKIHVNTQDQKAFFVLPYWAI